MKTFLKSLILSLVIFGTVACEVETEIVEVLVSSDSGDGNNPGSGNNNRPTTDQTHTGIITTDEIWYNNVIHFLDDKVVVNSGVTLTIEEGTVIKGLTSSDIEDAAALIVARGGKLNAIGSADHPIIFTAEDDPIYADQTYPSAANRLTAADTGLWGGIIVLGNARCSFKNNVTELQIEGIPASDSYGLYGGTNDSDDSGIIKYISIRHGGTNIGAGNEINGLTLGGVGAGTTISNIEVYANQDDGIEFFGGNVNLTNAVVWSQGDDAYDIDQSYAGNISNIVYIAGEDSDHAFEIDGREGTALSPESRNKFSISNATAKGPGNAAEGREIADFRSYAVGSITNSYFFNFGVDADIEFDGDGTKYTSVVDGSTKEVGDKVANNPTIFDAYQAGNLLFSNNEFNSSIGKSFSSIFAMKWSVPTDAVSDSNGAFDAFDSTISRDPSAVAESAPIAAAIARLQSENTSLANPSEGIGADTSNFEWTLAFTSGALDF